jgi:hypothetical protein
MIYGKIFPEKMQAEIISLEKISPKRISRGIRKIS